MFTEESIRESLKSVSYPGFSRDIVSFGLVKSITTEGKDIKVHIEVATRNPEVPKTIHDDARKILQNLPGVGDVTVDISIQTPPEGPGSAKAANVQSQIPGVRQVIAVASGKGGVGKSTVASNLAVALAATGIRVGLCDCDLYGPSISHMFGSNEQPTANENEQIIPIKAHGLQLMSMGFLLTGASPVIVRGPMATRYTQQFLRQVAWDNLDTLILDLPPGTGDIQLTIVQTVALTGALIVTTPQEVALIDARKAVAMFDKVNVKILGLIENMSWFQAPDHDQRYYIFGKDGGVRESQKLNIPLLGQIPITMETGEHSDSGQPIALLNPESSKASLAFHQLAANVLNTLPSHTT